MLNNPKKQCITINELTNIIGISRSSIYDRMDTKFKRYDATFPQPLKLGTAARWRLDEVDKWIELRSQSRG